jgi:CRISPR/Cas system-associated endonuclease Cas3-HD
MLRKYRAVLLSLSVLMGITAHAMPKRKNQVEEYKKLGFSLALIRSLDKKQEERAKRKRSQHAGYIAHQSKKKDAFLADLVNGQIRRLKAKKALEDQCRKNMHAEFRRLDEAREAIQELAEQEIEQDVAALGHEIDPDAWLAEQHDIQDHAQQEIWV